MLKYLVLLLMFGLEIYFGMAKLLPYLLQSEQSGLAGAVKIYYWSFLFFAGSLKLCFALKFRNSSLQSKWKNLKLPEKAFVFIQLALSLLIALAFSLD